MIFVTYVRGNTASVNNVVDERFDMRPRMSVVGGKPVVTDGGR